MPESTHTAKPLFSAGDTVMHASEGVCSVREIRPMRFGTAPEQLYYILKPSTVKSSSTVYMPVSRGNDVLRRLLSEADIDALIRRSASGEPVWVEDSKQRKEAFRRILHEGDYARIIRMIAEIHTHGEQRTAEGRKPCASDESVLAEAERLLHEEFSCVLHLSQSDTVKYIREKLASA
ncbi:MAG: CarD family transcriptional regulator [Clostridia bacterium]|nr:CarD family transcriptional regulator [Clostridia bacterium]